MKLKSFGLSDIGLSRSNNEDVWVALPEIGFFAIADGMGGHQAGEIAARETIHSLAETIKTMQSEGRSEWMRELRKAIEQTNKKVYQLSTQSDALNGMGTTLCCLVWSEKWVFYAHVGDSRVYRYRDKKLELLTQDHSLFAKWLKIGKKSETPFPYKNVITRAVGTALKANPEIAATPHQSGDLFLLCTDGLSDVLSLKEIEQTLASASGLESASKKLIHMAKMKGGADNMTILMVQIV